MKCPYCLREMEIGYIYNGTQPVQWIPTGKKPSMLAFSSTDEGIKLNNKFSVFKTGGYHAEAFYCKACRIVIAKAENR